MKDDDIEGGTTPTKLIGENKWFERKINDLKGKINDLKGKLMIWKKNKWFEGQINYLKGK